MLSFRLPNATLPLARKVLACTLLFAGGAASLQAKKAAPGLAWQVQGIWQVGGKGAPVRTGDAIEPASLLQPDNTASAHSIIVLLPDGQRFLYECFTVADCARGFRVPSLIHKPDPFAVEVLSRIGAILSAKQDAAPNEHRNGHATQTSRQEAVAVLDAANRVHVAGLVAGLPAGHYTYDLRPLDRTYLPQSHMALEKIAPSIELTLPAAGLYQITITDALDAPRVDLWLAAIHPEQSAHFQSFSQAREMMEKWNDDYAGWPIDEFLRAYLESLMQTANTPRVRKVQ
jgi:hypothetical protein